MPPPSSERTWELALPAVPASLDPVQDLVAEMYDSVEDDLNATDRIRFESAVVEIVANVIEHSRPVGDGPVAMRVEIVRHGRELIGVITDDGEEADVDLSRAAMTGADEVSGRGLAMALALSSQLDYDRIGDQNRWSVRCTCG